MVVEQQDPKTGYLFVTANAPVPLSMNEWAEVQRADTPDMRAIIQKDVGIVSWFATLDPSAKDVLVNIFVVGRDNAVEVSLNMRLRDKAAKRDRVRRSEPPPMALRIGLRKFWAALEKELATAASQVRISRAAPPAAAPGAMPGAENTNARTRPLNPDGIAVIVGNRTYPGNLPAVDFAHNDAEAFKRFVIESLGYRPENIIELRDATKSEFDAVLGNGRTHKGKLWRWIRPNETDVVVFYSGHGVPGQTDKRGYLLPVDAEPDAPEINGYPLELLYANLAKLDARTVMLFLETCFSGNSGGGPLIRSSSGLRVSKRQITGPALTVISAARSDQVASWDETARHGLFTLHLLKALEGPADRAPYGNNDGRITVAEVKRYLDREMSYAARRLFGRAQNATVSGDAERTLVHLNK